MAENPSVESPVSSIALDVNTVCKNSGTCVQTHCFRADFVVGGVSVLAAMSQIVSTIKYDKDGSFSVTVETSNFTADSQDANATADANVTATFGECGSASNMGEVLQIGDVAVLCIYSRANVWLSLRSVSANPGDQVLVNDMGEPNFVTSFNDNATSVTLRTLVIPAYFDAQGGSSGSIVIKGTAKIFYSARRLVSDRFLHEEVVEAPFGLQVPLARRVDDPAIAPVIVEEGNFGDVMGWRSIIPFATVVAAFALF